MLLTCNRVCPVAFLRKEIAELSPRVRCRPSFRCVTCIGVQTKPRDKDSSQSELQQTTQLVCLATAVDLISSCNFSTRIVSCVPYHGLTLFPNFTAVVRSSWLTMLRGINGVCFASCNCGCNGRATEHRYYWLCFRLRCYMPKGVNDSHICGYFELRDCSRNLLWWIIGRR